MSFQQGLSGLNAASKTLEAIGNNVANSGTVGFKSSQAQFADVFANSLSGGGGGSTQVGIGVKVSQVAQAFTQGNVTAVAIANTSPTQALTVSILFVTDGGAQSNSSLVLPPHTQQTFVAPTLNPAVAGLRGLIKFTAPTADISIVGLEFTSTGQFTSLGTFQ